jgi:hypothetical protein
MNDLQARIERLEAIHSIQQLKARALYYADQRNAQAFADLFTEEGVFMGAFQTHKGREMIQKNIKFWSFSVHYVMNPIVNIDGDRASGMWYWLRPQLNDAGQAHWAAGWYEDQYERIEGEWRFKSVKITNFFCSPYEKGWSNGEVSSFPPP